jgi:hypothetical protein
MQERDNFLHLDQTSPATVANVQILPEPAVKDPLLPSSQRMARSHFASAQNRGDNFAHSSAAKRSPTRSKILASAAGARQALATLQRARDHSPHSDVCCSSSPEPSDHSRRPVFINVHHQRRRRSSQSHGVIEAKNNNSRSPVVVRAMTLPLDIPRSTVSSPGLPSPGSLGKLTHAPRPRSASPMSMLSSSSSSSTSSHLSRRKPAISPSLSSSPPNKRRRARATTISANHSSSKSGAPSSLSGIGRKVADSLQLFRETSGPSGAVPTTIAASVDAGLPEYVVNSAEVVHPSSVRSSGGLSVIKGNGIVRDVSEHDATQLPRDHDQDEEIGGTVFVKRQAWPERESRAAWRFASITTTPSVRPSSSASPSAAAVDSSLLQRDVNKTSGSVSSWRADDAVWKYDGDRGRLMQRELRSPPNQHASRNERDDDYQSKATRLSLS